MDAADSMGTGSAAADRRGSHALDAAGREILTTLLAQGPTPFHDLPHRWPLIRPHLPAFVARLAACGLVAATDGSVGVAVELTPLGRRVARRSARRA